MTDLPLEEKATNADTLEHIAQVRNLINLFVYELLGRGERHDQSKLGDAERAAFTACTPRLRASTYGTPEYESARAELGTALQHHYANNRHHPEHHKRGVSGMNLVDLLEMLVDWKASTLRHNDGDIWKSLDIGRKRFGISDQLFGVLENTVRDFGLTALGQSAAFIQAQGDCYQDRNEGCVYGSIGGTEAGVAPAVPRAPKYIAEADAADYLRGYAAACRELGWESAR